MRTAAISPFSTTGVRRTATTSPSFTRGSMLSPWQASVKSACHIFGTLSYVSMFCSARIGSPHAISPTRGTAVISGSGSKPGGTAPAAGASSQPMR